MTNKTKNMVLNIESDLNKDAEINNLKNEYLLALGNLSIEKADIETVTSEEYKNLLKRLNEKDKELEEIKRHLDYIKNIIE